MRIYIKVKPNAKENSVEKVAENSFFVKVKAPAKENKANKEAVEALAEYFNVPKPSVSIKAGLKARQKTVEIT